MHFSQTEFGGTKILNKESKVHSHTEKPMRTLCLKYEFSALSVFPILDTSLTYTVSQKYLEIDWYLLLFPVNVLENSQHMQNGCHR